MRKNLVLFFTIAIVCCTSRIDAYDNFTPWDFTSQEIKSIGSEKELSLSASILKGGVVIFSRYISPVDGDRCFMYPTCAAYGKEAVEKHGFLLGIFLTVDRLIHEGNEMDTAPQIKIRNRLRYFDPVSNNDFWWH